MTENEKHPLPDTGCGRLLSRLLLGETLSPEEKSRLAAVDLDALSGENLSLRSAVESGNARAAELETALNRMKRDNRIRDIASASGCTVPDYLDFLAEKQQIDLDDAQAVEGFVTALKRDAPPVLKPRSNRVPATTAPAPPPLRHVPATVLNSS